MQLTLSRPKGPAYRKKPRRYSAPQDTPSNPKVNSDARKCYSEDISSRSSSNTREGEGLQEPRNLHPKASLSSRGQREESRDLLTNSKSRPSANDKGSTHPLSSRDSTPSGSPSVGKRLQDGTEEQRRLPELDLTSLAPEQKQVVSGVKRGWDREEGREKGGDKVDTGPSIKELSRKIHGKCEVF